MRTTTRLNAVTAMLDITVFDNETNELSTYQLGHGGKSWGWVPDPLNGNAPTPTLTIPVDMAESIMIALMLHFSVHATPIPDYRAYYEKERNRVDKLLDVIGALAEN